MYKLLIKLKKFVFDLYSAVLPFTKQLLYLQALPLRLIK